MDCIKSKAEEIRTRLNRELKVGDARAKVDEVLRVADIGYDYDAFQNRYQSTVRDSKCGPYQAVSVYISFDSSQRVLKIDVRETFTGP